MGVKVKTMPEKKPRSWLAKQLLPHREHEAEVAPQSGFSKIQHNALSFIHSTPVTYFLIFLLGCDVVLTLGEFIIQHAQCDYMKKHVKFEEIKIEFEEHGSERRVGMIRIPHYHVHQHKRRSEEESSEHSDCSSPSCYKEENLMIDSSGGEEHNAGSGSYSTSVNLTAYENATMTVDIDMELEANEGLESTEEVFGIISISIMWIFAAEILVLIFGYGPIDFFCNPFYLLDFVVITPTLVIEYSLGEDTIQKIILFLRLWRFIRIIHGVYAAEYEDNEHCEELKESQEKEGDVEEGVKQDAAAVGVEGGT